MTNIRQKKVEYEIIKYNEYDDYLLLERQVQDHARLYATFKIVHLQRLE